MPTTFGPNSPNMVRFFITDNPCTITGAWLEQFRSLETLNIERISMEEFPNDLLTGLINLKALTIGSSKAPNLTESRFSLRKLFFNNHIGSTFPEENFMNLEKLTEVTMIGGDRMITLPRFRSAGVLAKLILEFEIESLPDLSHLPKLSQLTYNTSFLACDYRLCWVLFKNFTFSMGELYSRCSIPQEAIGRGIHSSAMLKLGCYDSKLMRLVLNCYLFWGWGWNISALGVNTMPVNVLTPKVVTAAWY